MKRNLRLQYLVTALALTMAGLSSAAYAQNKTIKPVPARGTTSWKGVDLYREFCAVCHGVDGKGSGPAADALKQKPTDLTQITRRNNSTFPEIHLQQVIKGDASVMAHGSTDMPTWGNIFKSVSINATFGEMRVKALVTYLKEIQR